MTYAFIVPEIAEELDMDLPPRVTCICECGTTTYWYQDMPGNRTFDPVYCDGCGKEIGKT